MTAADTPSRPDAAIESLTNDQVQCDADGVMVEVSRQALDEVLAYLAAKLADDGLREAERMKGTHRYILAQAKAAHAGVLQVIIANAELALDDDQRRALSTKANP